MPKPAKSLLIRIHDLSKHFESLSPNTFEREQLADNLNRRMPDRPSRNYRDRDLKLLWGISDGFCSFAGCNRPLFASGDPIVITGKIGHIISISPNGPRADSSKSEAYLNSFDNLLLLCGEHHDIVDGQESTYTVETLQRWKGDYHERFMRGLQRSVAQVGFSELEVVCKALVATAGQPVEPRLPTPPKDKMERNRLSNRVLFKMTLGLSKASEVEEFVGGVGRLSPNFPEELKSGFLRRYQADVADGLDGDELFESLVEFARGGRFEFDRTAAGLAVLCYLFEKCEVFEP